MLGWSTIPKTLFSLLNDSLFFDQFKIRFFAPFLSPYLELALHRLETHLELHWLINMFFSL